MSTRRKNKSVQKTPSPLQQAAERRLCSLQRLHRLICRGAVNGREGNRDRIIAGGIFDEEKDSQEEFEYCFICDKPGELIMCDRCPRTYHATCVKGGEAAIPEDGEWLCSRCTSRSTTEESSCGPYLDGSFEMNNMQIDESNSNSSTFFSSKFDAFDAAVAVARAMLAHDYAVHFLVPVDEKMLGDDPNILSEYRAVIKKPCDLRSVQSIVERHTQLGVPTCNDTESTRVCERPTDSVPKGAEDEETERKQRDEDAVALVTDIRQVFHNCLLYNRSGSAIGRATLHLSRRLEEALQRHIVPRLLERQCADDEMKEEIDTVTTLEDKADEMVESSRKVVIAYLKGIRRDVASRSDGQDEDQDEEEERVNTKQKNRDSQRKVASKKKVQPAVAQKEKKERPAPKAKSSRKFTQEVVRKAISKAVAVEVYDQDDGKSSDNNSPDSPEQYTQGGRKLRQSAAKARQLLSRQMVEEPEIIASDSSEGVISQDEDEDEDGDEESFVSEDDDDDENEDDDFNSDDPEPEIGRKRKPKNSGHSSQGKKRVVELFTYPDRAGLVEGTMRLLGPLHKDLPRSSLKDSSSTVSTEIDILEQLSRGGCFGTGVGTAKGIIIGSTFPLKIYTQPKKKSSSSSSSSMPLGIVPDSWARISAYTPVKFRVDFNNGKTVCVSEAKLRNMITTKEYYPPRSSEININ